MAENTKIQWCDHTFNPWRGCTKVSPGCAHCYAEKQSKRNPSVLGVWGDNGKRVVAAESYWRQPIKWNAAAAQAGVRRRVFCASLADVFEELKGPSFGDVEEARKRLFGDADRNEPGLIEQTPHLDWLLLTKRPENVGRVLNRLGLPGWFTWIAASSRNVWLGTSVEDQQRADERIPHLLRTPAAVRFLSVEPLLGPVNLWRFLEGHNGEPVGDWVIVGGESGPQARPCRVGWVRSLVQQCRAASVACFVKQLGANIIDRNDAFGGWDDTQWPEDLFPEDVEHHIHGFREDYQGADCRVHLRDRKGGEPSEWPAGLRVRQFPRGDT